MSMIFQTRMNSPSLWSHKTSSFSLNLSGFLGCRSLQVLLEVHLSGSVGFRPKLKISPTGEFSLDPHAPLSGPSDLSRPLRSLRSHQMVTSSHCSDLLGSVRCQSLHPFQIPPVRSDFDLSLRPPCYPSLRPFHMFPDPPFNSDKAGVSLPRSPRTPVLSDCLVWRGTLQMSPRPLDLCALSLGSPRSPPGRTRRLCIRWLAQSTHNG